MATELGKAYVQIVPSAEGISGAISEVLDPEAAKAGKSAGGKLTATLKRAIAAAGIGKMLTDSIKEGAKYEQALGGIQTIFKDDFQKVANDANNAWKTVGMSATQYMENATLFGAAFSKTIKNTKEQASLTDVALRAAGDTANKFGMDMNYVVQGYQSLMRGNFQMLDSIVPGYAGTKTGLMELLHDTASYTEEQKKLGLTVDETSTDFDNIVKAIAVYNEHMGVAGTTSDEAARTISGSFLSMKAAATNFMGQLVAGDNLQASFRDLVSSTTTFLFDNLFPAVKNVLKNLPVIFTESFSDVHARIIDGIKGMTDSVKTNLPMMIKSFMEGLLDFSATVRERAGQLVDVGLQLIKSIADGIIKNIPVFIETVPTIISNFAGIINDNAPKILSTGWQIIKSLVAGIIQAIPVIVQNLPKIIKAIWDVFTAVNWINLGKMLITGIKNGISAIGSTLKGTVDKPITGIKGVFSEAWSAIRSKTISGFNAIKNAITQPITTAKTAVQAALAKIKGLFPLKVGRIFTALKVPSIAMSGGKAPFGIGGKGSLPKFSVKWHADGGIFTKPTLLNGGRDGVGEKGPEAILPLKTLWDEMENRVGVDYNALADVLINALSGVNIEVVTNLDGKTVARQTAPFMRQEISSIDNRNNRKLGYI